MGKPYDRAKLVARATELVRQRRHDPPEVGRPSVVVIDDSATIRESIRTLLEGAGFEVHTAASPEDGLRVIDLVRPRAGVVDWAMPGMEGIELIRRLREDPALQRTVCILMTGSQVGDNQVAAFAAGADPYIEKGGHDDELVARLKAMVRMGVETGSDLRSLQSHRRVLAVDDSPTFLHALADVLREEGLEPVLASSGMEALDLLGVQEVDCVLLDVVMPELDGLEVCSIIKSEPTCRAVPVIMLTAQEDRESMLAGMAAGADDFVTKSADSEVLKARLRAQIRRRRYEEENRRMRSELVERTLAAADAQAAKELAAARAELLAGVELANAQLADKNQELRRANEELDAFTYSVTHDLKAPVRAIQGFAQLISERHGSELSKDARQMFTQVEDAGGRLAQIIDDLLELSRVIKFELKPAPVDLEAVARRVLATLRQAEPNRQVLLEIGPGDLRTQADPRIADIVMDNLIGNAWKYTGNRTQGRIELSEDRDVEGGPAFRVRDNGAGFDPGQVSAVFEPFKRLHGRSEFPGSGVGLATVRRAVERHGGQVWADAEPDKGATFWFRLPAPRPPG